MKQAILITGATSGLGENTALALARRGHPLIVSGRRASALEALCDRLRAAGAAEATPLVADLASLDAVRAALAQVRGVPLRGIIANAGISTQEDARSQDGLEVTFAVNVLAHQLLLCGLAEQLVEGARVVVISSGVHEPDHRLARLAGVPAPRWVGARNQALPDEAPPEQRLPPGPIRYSTSKLANVLQARGLQERLRAMGRDVDVFAVDPGLMVDTQLVRELPAVGQALLRTVGRLLTPLVGNMRLSTETAGYLVSLIEDARWHGEGFCYLDGGTVKPPSPDALRDELVAELWRESSSLLGLTAAETVLPLS